jgi:hypothetical protein
MSSDAEMNIGCADWAAAQALREEVWGLHTAGQFDGGDGSSAHIATTFKDWLAMAKTNGSAKARNQATSGFLMRLEDTRTSLIRLM